MPFASSSKEVPMSELTWLERVEAELLVRKLPRQEVARLVTELADHLVDLVDSRSARRTKGASRHSSVVFSTSFSPTLKEDPMSMDASVVESLGSPADIADTAVREFRRRKNLLSRSSLAAFGTFALLPLPLLVAGWWITMLTAAASLEIFEFGLEWIGLIPLAPAWGEPADYFARRHVESALVPVDVAGLVNLSSSAVTDKIVRLPSVPLNAANVLPSK